MLKLVDLNSSPKLYWAKRLVVEVEVCGGIDYRLILSLIGGVDQLYCLLKLSLRRYRLEKLEEWDWSVDEELYV